MARFRNVTVNTTPTQLPLGAGSRWTLTNLSDVDVYINDTDAVNVNNGSGPLQAGGGSYTAANGNRPWSEVWAIASGSQTTLLLEVFN